MGRGSAVIALAASLLAGCASDGEAGSGPATVIATTSILADITSHVAGDCAPVEALVPAGADPHEYAPSARQGAALRDADVVLAFGLGLEESLHSVLDGAAEDGTPVVELSPELEPIPFREGTDREEGESHAGLDPHVWQDPVRMATATALIAEALAEHTACDRAGLEQRAADYADELGDLDRDIAARVESIPGDQRTLVTNHDALGYFADRYGFEIVGTVIPGGSTLNEPSSSDLAELTAVIDSTGVPAIFAENIGSADVAEALAAEVGRDVRVVELYSDSLGPEGSDGATYIAMMRANAERIADALGG